MTDDLRRLLESHGARFDDGPEALPSSFGACDRELDALFGGAAWSVDTPSVIVARGPDFLDLLHRLSTQDVLSLRPGEGCETVLTSPKGRIVERLWIHHLGEDGVLALGGPGTAPSIVAHFDRFTFAERTGIEDASDRFIAVPIRGPHAERVLEALGVEMPDRLGARPADRDGAEALVLGHGLLASDGVSLLTEPEAAVASWLPAVAGAAESVGGGPVGRRAVDAWRIARGIPGPGTELNEDHNPLEAGLREAVHFSKGCYVGQEVVARLQTYDKVARRLMVVLPDPGAPEAEAGASLLRDDREIGVLGSVARLEGPRRWIGLAYVKRARAESGSAVVVGSESPVAATILDPPVDPRG